MDNLLASKQASKQAKPSRDSNLELYRIVLMILIIAHHYVVNSGVMDVMHSDGLIPKSIFLYLFGAWGKTGINCFVMITSYFMCKSEISIRKFLKIFLQVKFYAIVFFLIFAITGYEPITLRGIIEVLIPIRSITTNFTNCFEIFYLLIPILNVLTKNMTKRQHEYGGLILVFVYVVLGTLRQVQFNYLSWFVVLYFIASYIRIYPREIYNNAKTWGTLSIILLALGSLSIVFMVWTGKGTYFFVSDSNTFLAASLGISSFLFFKNLNIGYSKAVNYIASATFGVFLIHTISDTMRRWLWGTLLNVTGIYEHTTLMVIAHAIGSVVGIFVVCAFIDKLRECFIEKPLFMFLDKYKWVNKKIG